MNKGKGIFKYFIYQTIVVIVLLCLILLGVRQESKTINESKKSYELPSYLEKLGENSFYIFIALIILLLITIIVLIVAIGRMSCNYKGMFLLQEKTNRILFDDAKKERNANNAKTEFLSKISHDIRTPINGIIGMAKIAEENINSKKKVLDCLDKIKTASNHLFSLINDVLDMSSIEKGKLNITKQTMDISRLIDDLVTMISYQSDMKNQKVVVKKDIRHKLISFDEMHLKQILMNIIGNAVKFTDPGGIITIEILETILKEDLSEYKFIITDNGIGMNKELLNTIFQPFVQGENSRINNDFKGSGLGMSIVKGLVDAMKGTIEIESEVGKGSKFIVTLPIDTKVKVVEKRKDGENKSLLNKKVLIVDDNDLNLEIVDYIVTKHGMKTELVKNGFTAYQMLKSSKEYEYDLVLMDILMPVMDGIEATRKIRKLEREDLKYVPIIGITANAYSEDEEKSLKAGMNAHISKPIIEEKLINEIKSVL